MIVYFAVGVDALKFLNPPPQISKGYLGMDFDFNCSTNDANATVKLFFVADVVNYTERTLSPKKLHLNKQVFTLLNLGVKDGGQYRCKATDGKENIEWTSTLLLSRGRWNTSIQYVQCSLRYVLFSKSNLIVFCSCNHFISRNDHKKFSFSKNIFKQKVSRE